MFLSEDSLRARAAEIIGSDQAALKDNSYVLHLGHEAASSETGVKPYKRRRLNDRDPFTVASGQLAYLITEEEIQIPDDCMGFISLDTGIKFLGLVDVSGFHVAPGYEGRLIFAVSNDSTRDIVLRRGDGIFRLWIAQVDKPSSTKKAASYDHLTSQMLTQLSHERPTVLSLERRIQELERFRAIARWVTGTLAAALIGWLVSTLPRAANPPDTTPANAAPQATPGPSDTQTPSNGDSRP